MATKLAVVGAGLMGAGIAQVAAVAGHDVVLRDVTDEALERGLDGIETLARPVRGQGDALDRRRRRGRAGPDHHDDRPGRGRRRRRRRRGRLRAARGQARGLPRARPDLPRRGRARDQHQRHPDHVDRRGHRPPGGGRRHALLLAGADDGAVRAGPRATRPATRRWRRPAASPRRSARPASSSTATSPGFVTTRLICALAMEAIRLVESGVASAEDIDTACRLGFGHAMGPLATTDLTGVDILRHATPEHLRGDRRREVLPARDPDPDGRGRRPRPQVRAAASTPTTAEPLRPNC